MKTFFYLLVYVFSALISYIYYKNKFDQKVNNKQLFISIAGMIIIQFGLNYIGIPNLNLLVFFLTNFLIIPICYQTTFWQALFHAFLLTAIMLTTELLIFYLSSIIAHTELKDYSKNDLVLFIQGTSCKLLYFVVAYIISRISFKEHKEHLTIRKTIPLFVLPVASIIILMGIAYITENYYTNDYLYFIFCLASILLIFSNIIVFMVHENTIRTQAENMELQLQKQKANIETEYYDILQKQYESSNVLIHDIKRHLLSVKQLALMNDCPAINDYIDSLYQEYTVKNNKVYSDNKLINVIVNRYATAFTENNIDFFCDIRSIDFSFISNADLTAVLDNLLENAFEATLGSEEKTVEFSILITNTRFITLIMNNSCSKKPNIKNQKLITSKNETTIHGYGMKSVQRIVNKYDGTISFNYEEQTNLFSVKIVFELPLN